MITAATGRLRGRNRGSRTAVRMRFQTLLQPVFQAFRALETQLKLSRTTRKWNNSRRTATAPRHGDASRLDRFGSNPARRRAARPVSIAKARLCACIRRRAEEREIGRQERQRRATRGRPAGPRGRRRGAPDHGPAPADRRGATGKKRLAGSGRPGTVGGERRPAAPRFPVHADAPLLAARVGADRRERRRVSCSASLSASRPSGQSALAAGSGRPSR